MGGKVCNIYDGIIYKGNFKVSPFEKVIEYLFKLKIKNEKEGNDLMVDLLKLYKNSLNRRSIRKDIDEEYIIRPEKRLVEGSDEKIIAYEALPNSEHVIIYKSDPRFDLKNKLKKIRLHTLLYSFFHIVMGLWTNFYMKYLDFIRIKCSIKILIL